MHSGEFLRFVIFPFRWQISALFALSIVNAIDLSLRPYLIKLILDTLVKGDACISLAFLPVLAYLALGIFALLSSRIYDYVWLYLNPPLKRTIGLFHLNCMMVQSYGFYKKNFTGTLGTTVKNVMDGVPDLIKIVVDKFFTTALALFIAAFTLWMVDLRFALAMILCTLCYLVVTYYMSRIARSLSDNCAQARLLTVGNIVDLLSNMLSVRFFARRKLEQVHMEKSINAFVLADQKRDWFLIKMFTVQGSMFLFYKGISIFWLVSLYGKGLATAGDFALVLTINVAIIELLWSLTWDMSRAVDLSGTIKQGIMLVLVPSDVQDKPGAQELKVTRGEIVFDKVDFFYESTHKLFQNKSVVITSGQKVGLVGYSGSGKTTFANLILRLFDVTSGRILIDGQDIKDVTQDSLHRAIGVIPQESQLFNRTIKENIRYGKPDATDEEVIVAAQFASAHDFIIGLPEGYDTIAGERGLNLSGGQRQRIAIARVALENAPILILDEATSQLDPITEKQIQDSLHRLMHDKTAIIIAHRLSTLKAVDRLLVFDYGDIVQDGTHEELSTQEGLYKKLIIGQ